MEVVEETVVIEEVVKAKPKSPAPEVTTETADAPEVEEERSLSSDSESEEEAEYHAQTPSISISVQQIKEEPEEEQEAELTQQAPPTEVEPQPMAESSESTPAEEEESAAQPEEEASMTPGEAPNGHAPNDDVLPTPEDVSEEEEPHIVNGNVSRVETELLPQVICCSEVNAVSRRDVSLSPPLISPSSLLSPDEDLLSFSLLLFLSLVGVKGV